MQMPVTAYQYVGMVFETLPVYFDYAGKTWLIQIWKGQYGICTGCEDDPLLRQQQRSIVIFVLLSALRRKTSDEASSYTRAKAVKIKTLRILNSVAFSGSTHAKT